MTKTATPRPRPLSPAAPLPASLLTPDPVNHPAHYGAPDSAYEAMKVIRAWQLNFSLGSVLKYVRRAGGKDPATHIEDLKKARWYLDEEIAALELAASEVRDAE